MNHNPNQAWWMERRMVQPSRLTYRTSNAMALVSFFGVFTNIPAPVVIYINLATVLGIIGLISYAVKHPLIEAYYHVGKLVSSAITGMVLLWGATAGLT